MDNLKKRLLQTQINERKLDNQHEKEKMVYAKIKKRYEQRKKANKAKQLFLNQVKILLQIYSFYLKLDNILYIIKSIKKIEDDIKNEDFECSQLDLSIFIPNDKIKDKQQNILINTALNLINTDNSNN
jgi:hypothetical protein